VQRLLDEAVATFRSVAEGRVADYIPALARVDPDAFGACIAATNGMVFTSGDADVEFSIQSVSKPFVFALVCDTLGAEEARARIGVNATGLPFNSVMAIELNENRTINPMVNAGAIATTSFMPGSDAEEQWRHVLGGLSRFAGRRLRLDEEVYRSEMATNRRNRGIAHLLEGYERLGAHADVATDVYTRQCSLVVSARDLAVMGATLADGGVNPVTRERVVTGSTCAKVLAVMASTGLYDRSGDWLFDIGLPGKSGVSGGIVTAAPGKGGLGVYAPRLDPSGNSVRGQLVTAFLSERLGLNVWASTQHDDQG
jgi:glutaminase